MTNLVDSPRAIPESRRSSPILGYARVCVSTADFGWRCVDGCQTLTIPPQPLRRALFGHGIALTGLTVVLMLAVMLCIACVAGSGTRNDRGPILAATVFMGGVAWPWGVVFFRLMHTVRHGRRPTVIQITPTHVLLSSSDPSASPDFSLRRDAIADVRGSMTGAIRVSIEYLQLELIDRAGTVEAIRIPWPRGVPALAVIHPLREAAGLPPEP